MNFIYQKLLKIIVVSVVLFSSNINAQTISVGFGPNYTLTNQRKPMINGNDYFDNTDYSFKFSFEIPIVEDEWSAFISFTKFEGVTFIGFKEGSVIAPDGFPTLAIGYHGTNITRYDLGLNWYIIKGKYLFLNSFAAFCFQKSTPDGSDYYDIEPPDGPHYTQLGPMIVNSINNTQLMPSLGFDIGIRIWNRLEIGLQIQGVYGFKSFQNMYFKYAYKGEVQETAVFETRGTGIFTSLNIGYRFKKMD